MAALRSSPSLRSKLSSLARWAGRSFLRQGSRDALGRLRVDADDLFAKVFAPDESNQLTGRILQAIGNVLAVFDAATPKGQPGPEE